MQSRPIVPARRAIRLSPAEIDALLTECRPSAVTVFLALMSQPERPQPINEVADRLRFDRKTVYVALRELVAAGLVEKQRNPGRASTFRRAR